MDFALILFVLVIVTGVAWVADKLVFLPRRRRAADAAVAEFDRQQARSTELGQPRADENVAQTRQKLRGSKLKQPWWLEYSASFFPVILVVFLLRSFVVEPYKIPSGSMVPTLLTGDFILVNKFEYGIRLPVTNTKITQGSPVKRGDVVVFHYPNPDHNPQNEGVDYIKRVVGLPGDVVAYQDKQLTINGQPVTETPLPNYLCDDSADCVGYMGQFEENLLGHKHKILVNPAAPGAINSEQVMDYPHKENCQYNARGVICKVPPGNYFMMGDNRDNSEDSRYWGFMPEANIVGRAFFIWMNFGNLRHIGSFE